MAANVLEVTGCQHPTVAEIVIGSYTLFGENHGKPAYKKDTLVKGVQVLLYYWDARDGPIFSGWWFGPKVGGDEVWAHNPDAAAPAPPRNGWKVPCNGPVDPTFAVAPREQLAMMHGRQPQGRGQKGGTGNMIREVQQARYSELEEKKRQIEENRRRVTEARLQALVAERQRRADEERRRHEELCRMQEQLRLRQEQERLEQERRILEGKAMMSIRRTIQKVRIATVDNFDEALKELEDVMGAELQFCTELPAQQVQDEARQCVEGTRARVDAIREQRRKEQEARDRFAREQAEREAKAREMVLELQRRLAEADAACQALKDAAAALDAVQKPVREEAEDALQAAAESEATVRERVKACADFMVDNQAAMKTILPDPGLYAREVALKAAVERRRKELEAQALAQAAANAAAQGLPPPVVEPPAEAVAPEEPKEKDNRTLLGELLIALSATKEAAVAASDSLPALRERVMKRVVATEKTSDLEATFARYDRDKDGVLNRVEVSAYARGEFKYSIPRQALDKILDSLSQDSRGGVPADSMVLLKCAVGISRQVEIGEHLKKIRLEREKELRDFREKLLRDIRFVANEVEAADASMAKVEAQVNPLGRMVKNLGVSEMFAVAERAGQVVQDAGRPVKAAVKAVEGIILDFEEGIRDDLREIYKNDAIAKKMEIRAGRLNLRIARAENLLDRFRADAARKEALVVKELNEAALAILRYNKHKKAKSSEEFFDEVDVDGSGGIDIEDFLKFFARADRSVRVKTLKKKRPAARAKVQAQPLKLEVAKAEHEPEAAGGGDAKEPGATPDDEEEAYEPMKLPALDEAALRLLFPKLLPTGADELSRDAFVNLVMLRYVVLQKTTLTDRLGTEGRQTVAALEESDVVEVIEGPVRDVGSGTWRVRARDVKDGAVGWATVRSNAGSTFLKEGGLVFRIVKETILTDCFDPSEKLEGSCEPKKLKVGEVLDVLEGPRKENTTGLTRLRARRRADGSEGWVTLRGNQGAVFARAVVS